MQAHGVVRCGRINSTRDKTLPIRRARRVWCRWQTQRNKSSAYRSCSSALIRLIVSLHRLQCRQREPARGVWNHVNWAEHIRGRWVGHSEHAGEHNLRIRSLGTNLFRGRRQVSHVVRAHLAWDPWLKPLLNTERTIIVHTNSNDHSAGSRMEVSYRNRGVETAEHRLGSLRSA